VGNGVGAVGRLLPSVAIAPLNPMRVGHVNTRIAINRIKPLCPPIINEFIELFYQAD
jgi:hypothetical protein